MSRFRLEVYTTKVDNRTVMDVIHTNLK